MTLDAAAAPSATPFHPRAIKAFRFVARSISAEGRVRLEYALDDVETLVETFDIPLQDGATVDPDALGPILDLLHWAAGVSYYKMAAPPEVVCETGAPPPATAELLEALYSEGLGEFAYENRDRLDGIPRPTFPRGPARGGKPGDAGQPTRVLVPVGGGKDSIVALETVRRSGLDLALFVVNALPPMHRTAEVAGLPMLEVRRGLPLDDFRRLNGSGALNGHVPITAIISCVALLTAKINGYDAIAIANERSASVGNLVHDGIEVNHQFSKSRRAEGLLRAAAAEALPDVDLFSILRPASELGIARAFAQRYPQYHHAFTSCNRNFHTDPALRGGQAWCRDCPKCRFVALMLAPHLEPDALAEILGGAILDDDAQYEGFALLTATGGHKPFECVGEEEESLAAIELLAEDPRWRDQRVVRRLITDALDVHGRDAGRAEAFFALGDEHDVPDVLLEHVRAVLGE
ncbi:hypothetical protein [Patulibacter minatonensis]|uniref:hypothetical protein n=1 Tax=Patulibacter minatonensis TaxID=298163 RepID=UPI0004B53243|nr:hypothetical protein [Patulibacter minatonensis]